MSFKRRDFLSGVMASASLPIMFRESMSTARRDFSLSNSQEATPQGDFLDRKTADFWTESVRSKREMGGTNDVPDPKRIPEFLIYTDETRRFRTIAEIQDSELFPSGDATVSLWVNQLRASRDDWEKSKNLKVANLRVDVQQYKSLLPTLEALGVLSYSLIAALFSKKAQGLPPTSDLNTKSGAKLQNVPLPGAYGKWTWNIFAQHEESLLGKFIQFVIKEAIQFAPLLSFPAATTPTLKAIDQLYGYWQGRSQSHWLFNDKEVDVYATKEAKNGTNPASAVPLIPGTYVLVPQIHLPKFKEAQNDLVVLQGLLVPKKTDAKDVHIAAKTVLPDVTYVTVHVSVTNWVFTDARTAPKK
jgi:hypothetical protein